MKKSAVILIFLLTVISGQLFSQAQQEQTKTPVKPALLIIDTQNAKPS